MMTRQEILAYLKELDRRLALELPKVSAHLKVYEKKLANGELTRNPLVSPQLND